MRIYAGRTGEMRAIELEELPKEIPIAKRSASEALLVVSPISDIDVKNYVSEEKKKALRVTMCAEQSRGMTEEGVMSTMEGEAKPKNLKISGRNVAGAYR